MSLKAQGSILGNIRIHIILFYWVFCLFFVLFWFLFLSLKYLMPFTETNIEKLYSSELHSLNMVHNMNTTLVSIQMHLGVRDFKVNPDKFKTL